MALSRATQFGFRWDYAPGFQDRLEAVLAADGTEVKLNDLRSVHKVEVDGRRYYVKRTFHRQSFARSAAAFVKRPRSRTNWKLSRKLASLGVPAPPALAYGERWDWRGLIETISITLGERGFVPLHELIDRGSDDLQKKLGRFLRAVHDRGVGLRDLHTRNILYSPTDERFCLVDLDTVSLRLSKRNRLDHLARLHSRMPLRPAFFEGYGREYASWTASIVQRAAFIRRRRCLKPNTDFETRKLGSALWHIRKKMWDGRLDDLLTDPGGFLETVESGGRGLVLKRSPSSFIAMVDQVVVKAYPPRPLLSSLKNLFRRSRALRAYQKAYHLELAGIRTARPIAAGTFRRGGRRWDCFVMEAIPDAASLWSWPGEKRRVTRALAELVAQLHMRGFAHRDLKDTNILLDRSGDPHLIDMEGVRYPGNVRREIALSNLARLGRTAGRIRRVSGRDKIRFVIQYCRCRGWNDWRNTWKLLEERTAALPAARLEAPLSQPSASPRPIPAAIPGPWVRIQAGGRAFAREGWETGFRSAGLNDLEDFFGIAGEPLSKPGLAGRYRARLSLRHQGVEHRVYLKRFDGERFQDLLKRWFEDGVWHSAAERELRVAEELARSGARVPQALAWGRAGRGTEVRSFVVLAEAQGEPLSSWLAAHLHTQSRPAIRPDLTCICELAAFARQFHSGGWRHRDFYLCHLFIDGGQCKPRFTLIDLQRVFRPRFRPERWRIKDLAQLHFSAVQAGVSQTRMLRFILAYHAASRLDARSKALIRAILRKCRRIRPR